MLTKSVIEDECDARTHFARVVRLRDLLIAQEPLSEWDEIPAPESVRLLRRARTASKKR
jgi:hypothetical protein